MSVPTRASGGQQGCVSKILQEAKPCWKHVFFEPCLEPWLATAVAACDRHSGLAQQTQQAHGAERSGLRWPIRSAKRPAVKNNSPRSSTSATKHWLPSRLRSRRPTPANSKLGRIIAVVNCGPMPARTTSAQADFEAAVKLDKTNWRAIHNRGVGYAARTKFAEAAADFDEVIRLHADFAAVWFNRGELRSQNADFNGAIDDYNQALKLQPNDPSALIGRGHAWYQLGENEEALKDYDRALELDGQRATTFVYRAAALAEAGRYAAAADDYRAAIRLEPNSAASYQAAAWLMATCPDEEFRDAKLAVKASRRAIELRGEDEYRDQETLAAALAEDGQFDAAVKAQQRAIELAGSTTRIWRKYSASG